MSKRPIGTGRCRICGAGLFFTDQRKPCANDSQNAHKACLRKQQLKDMRGRKPATR